MPLRLRRNSYYAEFNDRAQRPPRKYISLKTQDREQAEETYTRLRKKYRRGLFDPWQRMIVLPDVIDSFLTARSPRWREKTRIGYESILALLSEYLGAIDISTVSGDDIIGFLDSRPIGQVSRESYQRHLRSFARWCESENIRFPAVSVQRHKRSRLPHCVTREEWSLLREKLCGPLRRAAFLAYLAGLRRGEIEHLRWNDLNGRRITLLDTKSVHEQTVPAVLPLVREMVLWERGDASERVVPISGSWISHSFRPVADSLGIDKTFHGLRHGFGSRLVENGFSAFEIQRSDRTGR